jgi:predicted metal-dependent hydrolase
MHWSAVMGVAPKRVFLKNQRTLWGSCSSRGNLNFNRALAGAPAEIVDYVVIHELAHLKEMNHSRRFWGVVEAWCPEHKQRRRWLRQNASLLRTKGC